MRLQPRHVRRHRDLELPRDGRQPDRHAELEKVGFFSKNTDGSFTLTDFSAWQMANERNYDDEYPSQATQSEAA
jgi:hypothetical protein